MRKRTNKRHKKHITHKSSRRTRTRRNLHKKRKEILTLPGSQGLPLFGVPEKKHSQKILVNPHKQSGNMIPGLRNM